MANTYFFGVKGFSISLLILGLDIAFTLIVSHNATVRALFGAIKLTDHITEMWGMTFVIASDTH